MLHMARMLPIYGLDLCTFKYNMKIWQNATSRRKKGSSTGNSPPHPPLSLVVAFMLGSHHFSYFFFLILLLPLLLSPKAQLAVGHPFVRIMRRCQIAKRTKDRGPRTVYCAEYIKARRVSGSRVWALDDQLSICLAH